MEFLLENVFLFSCHATWIICSMFTDYRIYIVEYIVQFTKFGIHKVQLYIVDRYIDHLHSESWDIPDAIILQKKIDKSI